MSSDADDLAELESRLRSLERKLRRDKLGLEKLNPLVHADAYVAALEHVADLEAERRDLKRALRGAGDDEGGPDEDDDTSDDSSSDDLSDGGDAIDLRDRS